MARKRRLLGAIVTVSVSLALGACGATASSDLAAGASLLHWSGLLHVKRVVDLAGPGRDGTVVVATNGRLALLSPGGRLRAFARGANGYAGSAGLEPYIALATGERDRAAGCTFAAGGHLRPASRQQPRRHRRRHRRGGPRLREPAR